MSYWFESLLHACAALGETETVLGGMTVAWVTAGLAVAVLGWILQRESRRRTRRVVVALPAPSFPAPRPKIVLQLPRREWRS